MTEDNTQELDFADADVDLTDVPTTAPTIPKAEYHVRLVDLGIKESQKVDPDTGRKSKYVNYRVVVQSGPFAGESVFGMWSLKPKQLWRMKADFHRLGYEPEGGIPRKADLLGVEGIVKVTEKVRRDRDTGQPDASLGKENGIDKWLGTV